MPDKPHGAVPGEIVDRLEDFRLAYKEATLYACSDGCNDHELEHLYDCAHDARHALLTAIERVVEERDSALTTVRVQQDIITGKLVGGNVARPEPDPTPGEKG